MGSRVAAEHRQLDALFGSTRAALRKGDVAQARGALASLREALETHFEQEDRLYYPAIGALRRERKEALLGFARAHQLFRAGLAEIAGVLETGSVGDAQQAFERFAEAFSRHEVEEEELLRSLDEEIRPAV